MKWRGRGRSRFDGLKEYQIAGLRFRILPQPEIDEAKVGDIVWGVMYISGLQKIVVVHGGPHDTYGWRRDPSRHTFILYAFEEGIVWEAVT